MRSFILTAAILLTLQGCDSARSTQPSQPTQPTQPNTQRFVPIASPTPLFSGMQPAHFALDTATGRLCKSWDWNAPQHELNDLPACYSLTRMEGWEFGPDGRLRKKRNPYRDDEPSPKQ